MHKTQQYAIPINEDDPLIRLKKIAFGLLSVAIAIGAGVWLDYNATVSRAIHFDDKEVLTVGQGDTLFSIIQHFEQEERISKSWPYLAYAKFRGLGDHIRFGEYRFNEPISIGEFISKLTAGARQHQYRITILEGWTFRDMRRQINNAEKLQSITADWDEQRIMSQIGVPHVHPEGQFYPDTYFYHKGQTDLELYKTAYRQMQRHLDYAWANRGTDLKLTDRYELLTMASIIEKESLFRDEQPHISGVFNNRLKKGMRLQADPTVIYGLGDAFNGNLTRKHLRTDNPYNTYTRGGLPPTPIALPGKDALMAAANPIKTSALYFVAKGDGSHQFSDTLAEHNAAVRKYQLRRK